MDESNGSCSFALNQDDLVPWSSPPQRITLYLGGGTDVWRAQENYLSDDELDENGNWTCPHDAIDNRNRCIFHTPPENRPPDTDINRELLRTVEKSDSFNDGDRRRRHRQFIGAYLEKVDLSTIAETVDNPGPINLKYAKIQGFLQCDGVEFPLSILFQGAEFEDYVRFSQCVFKKSVDCSGALFAQAVNCKGTKFTKEAKFTKSRFKDVANFGWVTLEEETSFKRVTFEDRLIFKLHFEGPQGPINFRKSEFGGQVNVRGIFDSIVSFGQSHFHEPVNFRFAHFNDTLDFQSAFFDDSVEFEGMFRGPVDFKNCTFHGSVVFSYTTGDGSPIPTVFHDEVIFQNATFKDDVEFLREDWGGSMYPENPMFGDEVNFRNVVCEGRADFRTLTTVGHDVSPELIENVPTFGGETDFSETIFQGKVQFEGTSCTAEAELHFTDAILTEADFSGSNLNGASFRGAELRKAELKESMLESVDFRSSNLTEANLSQSSLKGSNLEQAILSRTYLFGSDLRDTALFGVILTDSRINSETKLGNICLYDPRNDVVNDNRSELAELSVEEKSRRAIEVYHKLSQTCQKNAFYSRSREFFIHRKELKRNSFQRNGNRIKLIYATLSKWVIGYGERPLNVIITSIIVIGLSSLLYSFSGGIVETDWMRSNPPSQFPFESLPRLPTWLVDLFEAVYFSIVTFTTLGYGDLRPAGWFPQLVATLEAFTGSLLMALLVYVLGRRAVQ